MAKISLGICLMFLVVSSTVYEVQGTFLLRRYMLRCPFRRRAFRPFACKGLLKFCGLLQHRCPLTSHNKNFFSKMKTFLSFIESSSGSSNFNADLKTQAQFVQSAMSQMGGSSGSADSKNVMNMLVSMGQTLGDTESGSTFMTRSQRREMIFTMITCARTIAEFVLSSSSNNGGASISMSSLGVDDDGDSPKSSGTSGGSIEAKGSVNTDSTTGSTDSTTGSTCKTCEGNTNGGSSFKGSLNFQAGQKSSQDSDSH